MKKLTIAGKVFEVSTPYTAGHTIDETEAAILNQTRAENIGNNCRKEVKEALEASKPEAEIAAAISAYDAKYTFSMGGAPREPADPIAKLAVKIAREAIRLQLAASGRKLKSIPKDKLEAAVEQVSQQEDVLEEARKQYEASKSKPGITVGIDLAA